ncbi:MAG: UrcA family protein [Oceanicaulis sp.]
MKSFISRAAIAATFAAAALSAPALAQDAPTFEFTVDRGALTSETDVRRAYQRLESEAGRYCQALDLVDSRATARCRFDVVANVVNAVGEERLAEYHAEQLRDGRMVAAAGGR